ncbi:MAG: hypothetical protein ACR2G2_06175 [Pseudonocardia sp.]
MTGDEWPAAVVAAERGAGWWRAAVVEQRSATADHGDFYALAGELVDTVRALESLVEVLGRQVSGYGEGRVLRDDQARDPGARLTVAVALLWQTRESLAAAKQTANRFWSEIGHIAAVEEA